MRRALVLTLVLAMDAAAQTAIAQTVYPDARRLSDVACRLDGGAGCAPSSGGGSGTGFVYDETEEKWIYLATGDEPDAAIRARSFAVQDLAENEILSCTGSGCTTSVLRRLADTAIDLRVMRQLSSTGTIVGSHVVCVTGSGAVVGTLDAESANDGQTVDVRREGANTCTIAVESGHTLDGVTDGTTTVGSGATKRFLQTSSTSWLTVAEYPVAHGVTTGYLPYGSTATAIAASQVQRVDGNTIRITNTNGTRVFEVCGYYVDASNYACTQIGNNGSNLMHVTNKYAGSGSTMGGGGMASGPETGGDYRLFGSGAVRFRITSAGFLPEGNGVYDVGNVSGNYPRIVMTTHGLQGGDSVALVDATATNILQVPVASGSYEGFVLHYTVRATDGTDQQVRTGKIPVAVINQAGTETCVFGTASEAVNPSTGTLTVTFDCTAGTNTVMVRANADTSLASTTSFTIQSFPILTSDVAVTTPQ